jgi:hypothetical protein
MLKLGHKTASQNQNTGAEMRFLLKVKGYNRLDKFRNEDIRRDLQLFSLNNIILEYKHKWFNMYSEWRITGSLRGQ